MTIKNFRTCAALAAAMAMTLHGPASAQSQAESLKSQSGISFMETSGSGKAPDQAPVDATGALSGKAKLVLSSPQPRARASTVVPAPSGGLDSKPADEHACRNEIVGVGIVGAAYGAAIGLPAAPFGSLIIGTFGAAGGAAYGAIQCGAVASFAERVLREAQGFFTHPASRQDCDPDVQSCRDPSHA